MPLIAGDELLPQVANPGQFFGQGVTTLVRLLGQGGLIVDFSAREWANDSCCFVLDGFLD